MCGRAACTLAPKQLQSRVCNEYHQVCGFRGEGAYHPTYNLCPTETAPVARQVIEEGDRECGGIVLQTMQWGLLTNPNKPINARVESVEDVAAFRRLLDKNRCVLYVSGFYEWDRHDEKEKKPYFVRGVRPGVTPGEVPVVVKKEEASSGGVKEEVQRDVKVKHEGEEGKHSTHPTIQINPDERLGFNDDTSPLLPMAGFWTRTRRGGGGGSGVDCDDDFVYSFSLITMQSSKSFSSVHHRLPAILQSPEEVREWLDVQNKPWGAVKHLMRPAEGLAWYRVDPKVGKNSVKTPDCIQPYSQEMQKTNQKTLHAFFGPPVKKAKVETEAGGVEAKGVKEEKGENEWNVGSPMRLKKTHDEDGGCQGTEGDIRGPEVSLASQEEGESKIEGAGVPMAGRTKAETLKREACDVKRVVVGGQQRAASFTTAKAMALTSPTRATPQKRSLQDMLSQPKLSEEETQECPVCGSSVRTSAINGHVNQCLDGGR